MQASKFAVNWLFVKTELEYCHQVHQEINTSKHACVLSSLLFIISGKRFSTSINKVKNLNTLYSLQVLNRLMFTENEVFTIDFYIKQGIRLS